MNERWKEKKQENEHQNQLLLPLKRDACKRKRKYMLVASYEWRQRNL